MRGIDVKRVAVVFLRIRKTSGLKRFVDRVVRRELTDPSEFCCVRSNVAAFFHGPPRFVTPPTGINPFDTDCSTTGSIGVHGLLERGLRLAGVGAGSGESAFGSKSRRLVSTGIRRQVGSGSCRRVCSTASKTSRNPVRSMPIQIVVAFATSVARPVGRRGLWRKLCQRRDPTRIASVGNRRSTFSLVVIPCRFSRVAIVGQRGVRRRRSVDQNGQSTIGRPQGQFIDTESFPGSARVRGRGSGAFHLVLKIDLLWISETGS